MYINNWGSHRTLINNREPKNCLQQKFTAGTEVEMALCRIQVSIVVFHGSSHFRWDEEEKEQESNMFFIQTMILNSKYIEIKQHKSNHYEMKGPKLDVSNQDNYDEDY